MKRPKVAPRRDDAEVEVNGFLGPCVSSLFYPLLFDLFISSGGWMFFSVKFVAFSKGKCGVSLILRMLCSVGLACAFFEGITLAEPCLGGGGS